MPIEQIAVVVECNAMQVAKHMHDNRRNPNEALDDVLGAIKDPEERKIANSYRGIIHALAVQIV